VNAVKWSAFEVVLATVHVTDAR